MEWLFTPVVVVCTPWPYRMTVPWFLFWKGPQAQQKQRQNDKITPPTIKQPMTIPAIAPPEIHDASSSMQVPWQHLSFDINEHSKSRSQAILNESKEHNTNIKIKVFSRIGTRFILTLMGQTATANTTKVPCKGTRNKKRTDWLQCVTRNTWLEHRLEWLDLHVLRLSGELRTWRHLLE